MSNDSRDAIDPPRSGLVGHWTDVSAGGHVRDRSGIGVHGTHGRVAKWIWYTSPRAVRFAGDRDRTYCGYVGGPTGADIVVGAYDHGDRSFETATLARDVSVDDHTGPAVFVRDDGRVLACWCEHDGPALQYRLTDEPEAIGTFGETRRLPGTSVTYPYLLRPGADGPLCLLYRERAGTGDGHVYYRLSDDGGATWGSPTRLVTAPDGHYSMYVVAAADESGIHCFFTDAEGGSTTPKWNVMYGRLDPSTGRVHTADGRRIGDATADPLTREDLSVVYDSTAPDGHHAWVWDAAVDDHGRPAVVYAAFPSSLAHEYRYARWTGDRWFDTRLLDAGAYVSADPSARYFSGGLAMPSDDPDIVYACDNRGERSVLRRLATDNGGRTFAAEPISDGVGDAIRPVVPEGRAPDCPVLWLAGGYTTIDGCQTVLRGYDRTGRGIDGDGAHGVSLGIEPYDGRTLAEGTLAFGVEPASGADPAGTLVDLGGSIVVEVTDDGPSLRAEFRTGTGTTAVAGTITPGTATVAVVGWGDGTATLEVGGTPADEAALDGPPALGSSRRPDLGPGSDFDVSEYGGDADRRSHPERVFDRERGGATLLARSLFTGGGFAGRLAGVRLYDCGLSASERERLHAATAGEVT